MPFAESDTQGQVRFKAFLEELRTLGWTDGRHVRIDTRWNVSNPAEVRKHAAELVALAPDVILAHTTPVAEALHQETGKIPIVFVIVPDPIESRFVASLARPGGNFTGVMQNEAGIVGKWLAMLKEISPRIARVGLIANQKTTAYDYFVRSAQSMADSHAIALTARAC